MYKGFSIMPLKKDILLGIQIREQMLIIRLR